MPTEPLAALVYIFLLVPGIAYVYESDKHRPSAQRSIFRETATVVVASSICFSVILILLLAMSVFSPYISSWLVAFIASPQELLDENPLGLLGCVLLFLFAASGLGLILGHQKVQGFLRGLLHNDDHIDTSVSGWWKSFELMPDAIKIVSVQLKSGRWLSGELKSYSPSAQENQDRSLVLIGKIQYRALGSKKQQVLHGVQSVVIQAAEIDYLGVDYVSMDAAQKFNE